MRRILVIGIGTGNPDHVTVQAIAAIGRADVFFVVDKGPAAGELNRIRREILSRYARPGCRVVPIADPQRDRTPAAYGPAVADWHAARTRRYEEAIAGELGPDQCGAFLVWGDPSLYDSTLRILDAVLAEGRLTFEREVIPGIASPQVLAAAHGLVLNGIGEPLRITTGRQLGAAPPAGGESVVVMLDDGTALAGLEDDLLVWWGACLGTPDEAVVAGRLGTVRAAIAERRAALKAAKGWVMDICLLRRPPSGDQAPAPP
jgi:precorrin-6A synthase